MKKYLVVLSLICSINFISAQKIPFYKEDFSGGKLPNGWFIPKVGNWEPQWIVTNQPYPGSYKYQQQAPPTEVTDEEIDSALEGLRNQAATFTDIEGRGLETEDFAVIDYNGTIEGKPVSDVFPKAGKPLTLAACMNPQRRDYRIYRDRARKAA